MIAFFSAAFIIIALIIATAGSGTWALLCLLSGNGKSAFIWIVVALFGAASLFFTLWEVLS